MGKSRSSTKDRMEHRSGSKGKSRVPHEEEEKQTAYVAFKIERAPGSDLVINVYFDGVRFN